jgi:hypothetical protein
MTTQEVFKRCHRDGVVVTRKWRAYTMMGR